jgi:hypothetical protein
MAVGENKPDEQNVYIERVNVIAGKHLPWYLL